MVRTLMHFPTVMADSWVVTIHNLSMFCREMVYTYLSDGNQSEKYALALMEALFTDEEIAPSCYCVMIKVARRLPCQWRRKVF